MLVEHVQLSHELHMLSILTTLTIRQHQVAACFSQCIWFAWEGNRKWKLKNHCHGIAQIFWQKKIISLPYIEWFEPKVSIEFLMATRRWTDLVRSYSSSLLNAFFKSSFTCTPFGWSRFDETCYPSRDISNLVCELISYKHKFISILLWCSCWYPLRSLDLNQFGTC